MGRCHAAVVTQDEITPKIGGQYTLTPYVRPKRMVQAGLEPTDWKPFDDVGAGTREIRIREASGIYHVMYVAKFEEAIYVLHCFEKKTQVPSKQDRTIAAVRYRAVVNVRKEKNEGRYRNPPCDKAGREPLLGTGFYAGRGQTSTGCVPQTDK